MTHARRRNNLALWLLFLACQGIALSAQPADTVTIGVLAKRGFSITLQRWSPTIDYLNQSLPEYYFSIRPLDFKEIPPMLEARKIDFLLANSAIYIQSEHDFLVFRIATLINRSIDHPLDRFGGVIFTRADNPGLQQLHDLKDRTLAAVDDTSFGGYLMAQRELEERGIDTANGLTITFMGTHDAVVRAVLDGRADAGTVRTDTLERMAEAGLIELDRIKLLNPMPVDGFPYLLSTRLYPEWPVAALKHVSNELVKAVSHALMSMPPDHPAALASKTYGWTVPANYQPVHELFRSLNLPPHRQPPPKLIDWIRLHPVTSELFGVMLLILIITLLRLFKLNHRLACSQRHLTQSLKAEERSAAILQSNMERLKESEEKFSSLAVSALDGIIMLDPHGRVSFWNLAAEHIFGYSSSDAIGLEVDQWLVSDTEGDPAAGQLNHYIGTHDSPPPGTTLQVITRRQDGELFPSEIAISSVQVRKGWYVICVLRDITYRKQLESERRHLETELAHRHKMQALAQLSDGISHEINTPMQAIGNNLEFLLDSFYDIRELLAIQDRMMENMRQVPSLQDSVETFNKALEELDPEYLVSEVEQAVNQSLGSSEQVKRIVRSLRIFASPDSTETQRTDLNKLIQDLVAISHKLWSSHADLQLDLQVSELVIDAFPGELSQALLNLMINASQAIEESDATVPGLIEITVGKQDGLAIIDIRDNGTGIPPEVSGHIFNPFFTTREQGKGSGQGLTLSHDVIVRRHGGKLSFQSEQGEGTTFTISLPLHKGEETSAEGYNSHPPENTGNDN
ncbi:MAG: PhnD/SsuA/transferrin family substrate-binding protein [Candidatus Thiodiazotropha endolucinida]